MSSQLWRMGASDLAMAIRQRRVSSREVLEAHFERIADINPHVSAITRVLADEARASADEADHALRSGRAVGALHGVPVTVKVNIDVGGSPTDDGMPAFAETLPASDAPLIARLRAAGAIPFARTNMPDLGLRWHTASSLHGATVNPWNRELTPGGSSGGESVAVATGMSPLGIGNDIGGSVRWPSQCCGTSALRPTHGRLPRYASTLPIEMPPGFQLFLTDGPIARHVRDLRTALAVCGGRSPYDPWSLTSVERSTASPLRVAYTVDPAAQGCDPSIVDGVRRAVEVLHKQGCTVEEAEPASISEAHDLWGSLVASETRLAVAPVVGPLLSGDATSVVHHLIANFSELDHAGYLAALARRTRVAREWEMFFERFDVLLGPVSCAPPFRVGDDLTADGMARLLRAIRLVTPCNLLGLPAAVVPVGMAEGLPQSVQVIAGRFGDEACLAAAQIIEDGSPPIVPIDPQRGPCAGLRGTPYPDRLRTAPTSPSLASLARCAQSAKVPVHTG
jgi:amidase